MLLDANFVWVLPETTFPGNVPSGLRARAMLSPWPETAEENFFSDLAAVEAAADALPTWFLDKYPSVTEMQQAMSNLPVDELPSSS
eukprot:3129113-Prorocentrum_lima.AAC.1